MAKERIWMDRLKLKAELRDEIGSRPARRLRSDGEVPAVLYGHHHTPVALKVNTKDMRHIVGKNAILDVEFGNDIETVVLKGIQRGVIGGDYLHADFQVIGMDERINISVPVNLEGTGIITRKGGVIQRIVQEVEIECLPAEIPDHLSIDVSMLDIGDAVTVGDLALNTNLTVLTPAHEVIATISAPSSGIENEDTNEENITTMPEILTKRHDPKAEEAANKEAKKVY